MPCERTRDEQRADALDALNEAVAVIDKQHRCTDRWQQIFLIGALSSFHAGYYAVAAFQADKACISAYDRHHIAGMFDEAPIIGLTADDLAHEVKHIAKLQSLKRPTFSCDQAIR